MKIKFIVGSVEGEDTVRFGRLLCGTADGLLNPPAAPQSEEGNAPKALPSADRYIEPAE